MKYKGLIKLAISVVMLTLIIRLTDFDKLSATVRSLSLSSVIIVVLVFSLGQILSAFKWFNILKAAGISVSFAQVLRSYFIGMFVNCFGFGTVGGDVTRALMVAGSEHSKVTALSSVIADRAHGLAVLATIGSLVTLIFGSQYLAPQYSYLMVAVGASAILGWFIGPFLVRKIFTEDNPIRIKMENVLKAFPHNPKVILVITLISIVFHTLQISLHYLMGYFLFVDLPMSELFIIIPIINILATLPISWNGLGVREQAYTFFLAPHLVSIEQALTFGALWLLSVTVCSAIGGLLSAMTPKIQK